MKNPFAAGEPGGQHCIDCAVRPLSVCAALDGAELQELEHLSRHVRFVSGATVFVEDEIAASFYNVLEGVLRLYKLLADGRRQIVGFALPGDFLGMAATARHGYSADAIGPVTVCRFYKSSFARFIENRPHLLRRINEMTARELNQAQQHMVLLGRRTAEERVASFLIGWRDRLAAFRGPSCTVLLPMSRQDIADFLGLTIETVSRTFTKFERDGVIEIARGRVGFLDAARAEALAAA